jgi:glycerol-1-phosphate dehydrogenase [NAD(P)+]
MAIAVQGGAIGQLGDILADNRVPLGTRYAVVIGAGMGERVAAAIQPGLAPADVFTAPAGRLEDARALEHQLRAGRYDSAIAIGGGKLIDTAKYATTHLGMPMVSVPTSLAHDGVASPMASLARDGMSVSYGVQIPLAVVVDLDYVKTSPVRLIRSGVGDALSNLNAVADWELAHRTTGEPLDGLAVALARTSAEALLLHPGALTDDDFLTTLAHALVLGGMASAVAGSSRPCSGGCHEISHAIDAAWPGTATHGEQVGVGALFCGFLRGDDVLFGRMLATFRRHGLAVAPADLGLTADRFAAAVAEAPATRPGRYTILEHLDLAPAPIRTRVDDFITAVTPVADLVAPR